MLMWIVFALVVVAFGVGGFDPGSGRRGDDPDHETGPGAARGGGLFY